MRAPSLLVYEPLPLLTATRRPASRQREEEKQAEVAARIAVMETHNPEETNLAATKLQVRLELIPMYTARRTESLL